LRTYTMTQIESELKQLKQAVVEMMELAGIQVEKARDAFMSHNSELAEEVVHNETRMNAYELSIDRDCENLFALYHIVATDLRFAISSLKINSDLERIGDYADGIADYVVEMDKPFEKDLLEKTEIQQMFDLIVSMMDDVCEGFENKDNETVRKVFKKDHTINKINVKAADRLTQIISDEPTKVTQALYLFSTIKKLERVGDHIKNIAENIIFYREAEVLKHKKQNKKNE
ncbi:MAG: phosphate signaling complex protein PhoU, partial [Flavobacteriales bacterium]